jgi:hypothetical protein
MFAVSNFIRESGLLVLMKPLLKSFRKGNFALSAAILLSEMAVLGVSAGSFMPPVSDASSFMYSWASMIVEARSSGLKSVGMPVSSGSFKGKCLIGT